MTTSDYDPAIESTQLLWGRLTGHVLMKGWQAGSLIGICAVVPIQALLARAFSLPKAGQSAGIAALVGVGLSGLALAAKAPKITREGLEDRVYRLHYNEGQNRVDRLTMWGSVLGFSVSGPSLAAARYSLMAMTPLLMTGGAAAGCTAGLLLHAATRGGVKEGVKKVRLVVKEEVFKSS